MTIAPETVNRLPTEEFAKYEKDDKLILLSTGEQGIAIKNDTLPSAKQKYLIYAENVTIAEDIVIPGKTLILCCSNLKVSKKARINANGSKGLAGKTGVGNGEVPHSLCSKSTGGTPRGIPGESSASSSVVTSL